MDSLSLFLTDLVIFEYLDPLSLCKLLPDFNLCEGVNYPNSKFGLAELTESKFWSFGEFIAGNKLLDLYSSVFNF